MRKKDTDYESFPRQLTMRQGRRFAQVKSTYGAGDAQTSAHSLVAPAIVT